MKIQISHRLVFLVAAMLILGALSGCARDTLNNKIVLAQKDLAEIDAQGAKLCAPKEFASAEAHLAFARDDWYERNYIQSSDHLTVAKEHMATARNFLGSCAETQPTDKDGDGILDNVDQCPDQPEDIDQFQDEDGCPDPDNDNDGILDAADKCPSEAETMNGVDDEDGCPDYKFVQVTEKEITLKEKIHFETNSAVISPESYNILEEIKAILDQNPTWKLSIEGHTDASGDPTKNLNLSQARAESCRNYLVQKGITADRLTSTGYGPTRPIAPNQTEMGRAMNRRVEFKIVSK